MSSVSSYCDTSLKFTRGEKCIFTHLVITFVAILIMIIIYFVHLCLVEHTGNEIFRVARKSFSNRTHTRIDSIYHLVGIVYMNISKKKIVCNTILFKEYWSVAPAHIVASRSDPDLSKYLPAWSIKYIIGESTDYDTGVQRSLVHTQYNRDDYRNNIGLLKHSTPITVPYYLVLNSNMFDIEQLHKQKDLVLITWNVHRNKEGEAFFKTILGVNFMNFRSCSDYMSPLIDQLRKYEFCAKLEQASDSFIYHGAVFATHSNVGFFSWGDRSGKGVPLIILNVVAFRGWLEDMTFI